MRVLFTERCAELITVVQEIDCLIRKKCLCNEQDDNPPRKLPETTAVPERARSSSNPIEADKAPVIASDEKELKSVKKFLDNLLRDTRELVATSSSSEKDSSEDVKGTADWSGLNSAAERIPCIRVPQINSAYSEKSSLCSNAQRITPIAPESAIVQERFKRWLPRKFVSRRKLNSEVAAKVLFL